jgi:hypothetical protein
VNFGFYFERARLGASQGAIDPAEQFFEGSQAETSLARETAQNTLDVPADDAAPVVMTFELAEVACDEIPGISGLRQHLAWVELATRGTQGHERMKHALETANAASIHVLRIGDTGTTGLAGSESRNDPTSPLSALTRGAGISRDDGSRGGSFGIGSAVGLMSSAMCTVLYASKRLDDPRVVFSGHSRLASHRDGAGEWRMGDGFYTDLDNQDDFRYERDPAPLKPFVRRTETGTDIFVLGYRKAESDPSLQHIKDALVTNFMLAIHRGHLVAQAVDRARTVWRLDSSTLRDEVRRTPEAHAFYRAITDTRPIVKNSRRFGELRLYIHLDDTLDRTLHTITMRRPLMKIDTFKHTSIPAKYAAVLECSDAKGNTLLRRMEPPQHDRWDPARADDGANALNELKTFVRNGLKDRVKQQIGEQVEIKGLARYLPSASFTVPDPAPGRPLVLSAGERPGQESSTVHGAPGDPVAVNGSERRAVPVRLSEPATSGGAEDIEKGKDRGGEGTREDSPGDLAATGRTGTGRSRVRAGDIRFRSWSEDVSGDICMALTAGKDVRGDLELVALGPGGAVEENYVLPISSATVTIDGRTSPVSWNGNVLLGLDLHADLTARVRLSVPRGHRYRLGVR